MNEEEMSSAVSEIASDIGLGQSDTTEDTEAETVDTSSATSDTEGGEAAETPAETAPPAAVAPTPRAAPKAWAKEQHERWSKLDKDTQDYIELREKQFLDGLGQYSEGAKAAKAWDDALKDYMPILQQQGVTPHNAVRYLFEAHKGLSSGTPEQRAAYLQRVAKSYGITLGQPEATNDEPAYVKELREKVSRLEGTLTESQRAVANEQRTKITNEVSAFADAKDEKGNAKHPYFDECANHIAALIGAGHALEEAYEMAVYANPVTRAKELARLKTEEEAALRAKAKQEADKARHAKSTNVDSRDTRRTPTAPKAKRWEDTLDETYKEIKERTH